MNRFVMTAATAAMLCGATFAAANAEYYAGPMHNEKQRCFKGSSGWREMGFGYWSDCPAPAQSATQPAEPSARAQAPARPVHHPRHASHQP